MRNNARPNSNPYSEMAFLTKRRAGIVIAILCLGLLITALIALSLGSEPVSLIKALSSSLTHEQEIILFDLRMPRIALAIGTGAALAMAGAAFQSLLRNPLADPYVLGVSSGAALGAIIAIIIASNFAVARPLLSFAGAGAATFIVYVLGRRDDDPARLILAGVVISTLLSSLMVLLTTMVNDLKLRNITFWLLGDLSSGSNELLPFLFTAVGLGCAILFINARALNLLMAGEREAFSLGVETARVRAIIFVTASLLIAAAVSTGGAIGYVGLVVPHLVRLAGGADNRLVIPASGLAGALLVLMADTTARTVIAPRELPTGAITALIGAPVLIYLLIGREKFRLKKSVSKLPKPGAKTPHHFISINPSSIKLLQLQNVGFSYDHEIFSRITLELYAGEVMALLGPNGAGKSTLMSIAGGKLHPHSGLVLLNEKSLDNFSRREIAKQIAVVSQAREIHFPLSSLEYVLAGRFAHSQAIGFDSPQDVEIALQALSAMDARHFAERLFNQLSSGEKQRVAIARALAQQPKILLLDEPTAHLDLSHQISLLNLIRRLAHEQQLGILLVTHEISLARQFSERAALLKDGRILAAGKTCEIMTTDAIRELFSVPYFFEELK